jgi:YD repeat-containing protein
VRRKLIEWTLFGLAAAGTVLFVRWFVPWAAFEYYRATARPAPPRLDPALRQRLRETEDKLAVDRRAVPLGQTGLAPCMLLGAKVGIGSRGGRGAATSVEDCRQLVPGDPPWSAVEVDLTAGTPILIQTDVSVPGNPPIAFTRVLEPLAEWNRKFSVFLPNVYDTFPTGDRLPYTHQTLWLADRSGVRFQRISKGTGYADAVYEQTETRSVFYHALEGWTGDEWDLDLPDGRTLVFPEAYYSRRPQQGALVGLIEPSGASLVLERDRDGNLQAVRASDGRWLKLSYRGALVEALSDSAGEKASYSYDGLHRLATATNAEGETFLYRYNPSGNLTAVLDGKTSKSILEARYDSSGQITSLQTAGAPGFHFAYRTDAAGHLEQVDLRDSRGSRWTVRRGSCSSERCTYEVSRR